MTEQEYFWKITGGDSVGEVVNNILNKIILRDIAIQLILLLTQHRQQTEWMYSEILVRDYDEGWLSELKKNDYNIEKLKPTLGHTVLTKAQMLTILGKKEMLLFLRQSPHKYPMMSYAIHGATETRSFTSMFRNLDNAALYKLIQFRLLYTLNKQYNPASVSDPELCNVRDLEQFIANAREVRNYSAHDEGESNAINNNDAAFTQRLENLATALYRAAKNTTGLYNNQKIAEALKAGEKEINKLNRAFKKTFSIDNVVTKKAHISVDVSDLYGFDTILIGPSDNTKELFYLVTSQLVPLLVHGKKESLCIDVSTIRWLSSKSIYQKDLYAQVFLDYIKESITASHPTIRVVPDEDIQANFSKIIDMSYQQTSASPATRESLYSDFISNLEGVVNSSTTCVVTNDEEVLKFINSNLKGTCVGIELLSGRQLKTSHFTVPRGEKAKGRLIKYNCHACQTKFFVPENAQSRNQGPDGEFYCNNCLGRRSSLSKDQISELVSSLLQNNT